MKLPVESLTEIYEVLGESMSYRNREEGNFGYCRVSSETISHIRGYIKCLIDTAKGDK